VIFFFNVLLLKDGCVQKVDIRTSDSFSVSRSALLYMMHVESNYYEGDIEKATPFGINEINADHCYDYLNFTSINADLQPVRFSCKYCDRSMSNFAPVIIKQLYPNALMVQCHKCGHGGYSNYSGFVIEKDYLKKYRASNTINSNFFFIADVPSQQPSLGIELAAAAEEDVEVSTVAVIPEHLMVEAPKRRWGTKEHFKLPSFIKTRPNNHTFYRTNYELNSNHYLGRHHSYGLAKARNYETRRKDPNKRYCNVVMMPNSIAREEVNLRYRFSLESAPDVAPLLLIDESEPDGYKICNPSTFGAT